MCVKRFLQIGDFAAPTSAADVPAPPPSRHLTIDPEQETPISAITLSSVLETPTLKLDDVATHAPGPQGQLPITPEMLMESARA